jgi:hypothetical protein
MNQFNVLMRRMRSPLFPIAALMLLLAGCSKTVTVQLPPRVDLAEWPVIGVVQFSSDTHGKLAESSTQKFIMNLQSAQPGVRLLELGGRDELLQAIAHKEMDPAAIKAIGQKYGVQAVFTGQLSVTEAKPNVSFSRDLSSASAGASINGKLDAKLQETATGATAWSNGAHGKWSIGGLTLGSGGISDVGYSDPDEKYEEMIRELANVATNDFRPRYEERDAD